MKYITTYRFIGYYITIYEVGAGLFQFNVRSSVVFGRNLGSWRDCITIADIHNRQFITKYLKVMSKDFVK